MKRIVVLCALGLLAAGCGGTSEQSVAVATKARPRCAKPRLAPVLAKLNRDVASIERASGLPTKNTLDGNAAINAATDKFLLDVDTSPLDNVAKMKFINRAAAALHGACEQCFQALEADRPIPAIAQGGRGAGCRG